MEPTSQLEAQLQERLGNTVLDLLSLPWRKARQKEVGMGSECLFKTCMTPRAPPFTKNTEGSEPSQVGIAREWSLLLYTPAEWEETGFLPLS